MVPISGPQECRGEGERIDDGYFSWESAGCRKLALNQYLQLFCTGYEARSFWYIFKVSFPFLNHLTVLTRASLLQCITLLSELLSDVSERASLCHRVTPRCIIVQTFCLAKRYLSICHHRHYTRIISLLVTSAFIKNFLSISSLFRLSV